jgi:hypothetical protein
MVEASGKIYNYIIWQLSAPPIYENSKNLNLQGCPLRIKKKQWRCPNSERNSKPGIPEYEVGMTNASPAMMIETGIP